MTLDEFADGCGPSRNSAGTQCPTRFDRVAQLKLIFWLETFGATLMERHRTLGDDPSVAAMEWYKEMYDEALSRRHHRNSRGTCSARAAPLLRQRPIGASIVVANSPTPRSGRRWCDVPPSSPKVTRRVRSPGEPAGGDGRPGAVSGGVHAVDHLGSEIALGTSRSRAPSCAETGLADAAIQDDPFLAASPRRSPPPPTSPLWAYPSTRSWTELAEAVQRHCSVSRPTEAMTGAGEAINSLL